MKRIRLVVSGILVLALAACGTPGSSDTSVGKPAPPGYYTVQKGDTLYSIGRKFRQNHSSIAAWNKLGDVNGIEVGQVLRVVPPNAVVAAGGDRAAPAPPPVAEESRIDWMWPTEGVKTGSFSSSKKGIEIAGRNGQPVLAAASGKVMYAGAGIRGYGNLVIVKHNASLLSVYAHNKVILAKEGQMVSKGQQIAEMGKSDSSTVKLYFEIRRDGKPIDPSGVLPGR